MEHLLPLYVYNYHEVDDLDANCHYIEAHCLDHSADSVPTLLRTVYEPSFYIELPPLRKGRLWRAKQLNKLIVLLQTSKQTYWRSCLDDREYTECENINCRTVFGYLDGNKMHLKVRFKTKKAMRDAKTRIERAKIHFDNRVMQFKVSESDVESVRQFTVEQNVGYCDWLFVDRKRVKEITDERKKISTFKREYWCVQSESNPYPWTAIGPCPLDYKEEVSKWRVHPRIGGYDTEEKADSKLKFPSSYNPHNPVRAISLVYQVQGKPETKRKYCVIYGNCTNTEDVITIVANSEEDMLNKFFTLVDELDIDILVGHYNLGFDDEYIKQRYQNWWKNLPQCGSRIKNRRPEFHDHSWQSSNTNVVAVKYIELPGRITFDTKRVAQANILVPLPSYSLKMVSEKYLEDTKLDVGHEEIFETLDNYDRNYHRLVQCVKEVVLKGKKRVETLVPHDTIDPAAWTKILDDYNASLKAMGRLLVYCAKDSDLALRIFEKLNVWINVGQAANIIQVCPKYIYTKGQQYKSMSQLYGLVKRSTPEDPHGVVFNISTAEAHEGKYEGAINWGTETGFTGYEEHVGSIDVKSMYPSIIAAYNLCVSTEVPKEKRVLYDTKDLNPHQWTEKKTGDHYDLTFVSDKIHLGFIPRLVKHLVSERQKVKKLMETALSEQGYDSFDYLVYNAIQNALKISANSVYGVLGMGKASKMPAKHIAALVTKIGRDTARRMAAFLRHGGDPSKPPVFPPCEIIYGDTDSLQFLILDSNLSIEQRIQMSKEITDAINKYIYPLEVELEKWGDIFVITPKKYVFHFRDVKETNRDGTPNASYGKYIGKEKDAYKFTGVEFVKRNQPEVLKRLYRGIIYGIMSEDLAKIGIVEVKDKEDEGLQRLQYIVDLTFKQLYLLIHNKNKLEDYIVYEAYNGEDKKLGPLGVNMAAIGKPIQVGERVGYLVVDFNGAKKLKKKADKYRLIDGIGKGERVDIAHYLTSMMTPIDKVLTARYQSRSSRGPNIFLRWFEGKHVKDRVLRMLLRKELINKKSKLPIDQYIMQRLIRNMEAKGGVPDQISGIKDYSSFVAYRATDDYADNVDKKVKSALTRHQKTVIATGLPLALPTANLVENIALAYRLGVLDDFARIMMSPTAYKDLRAPAEQKK